MAKGRSYAVSGGHGVAAAAGKSVILQDFEGRPSERSDGNACIAWDREGQHLITSTSHALIFFHRWPSSSPSCVVPLRCLSHHRSAITALALSPSGNSLASGSLDHSVKLFSYPEGEFQSNVTRFTLPIRAIAFSPTGALLAAGGEDDGIKLISTIDSSIVRVLKGHNAPIVSLAIDPANDFVASAGSDGTIMCWCLSSGKRVHSLYHAAPNTDLNNSGLNAISWHPKGDVLAVPGRKNGVDVVMYDRDTGEKAFSLKGGHSASVGFLAWSPNGRYLATAGGDNQVIVWDVVNRQDIDCQKFEAQICSLAWKPKGNALAVIDSDGKFGVWESVIPSHMTLPNDNLTLPSTSIDREELLHFSDNDDAGKHASDGDDSSFERELDTSISQEQKRYKEKKAGRHKCPKQGEAPEEIKNKSSATGSSILLPHLQASFQPCSTQASSGMRYFLSYNLIGSITSCQNDGLSHIEVEFHDTGRGVRVPSMTDYFGFTIAAMNDSGSVFASPRNGEKSPSTILYRPFTSWANNSEWSMRLASDEEVRAVALGPGWVAASTNLNYLRLFSEGGLQKSVLSLPGPIVTMAGHRNFLALVTHASSPFPCHQQVLNYLVLNVAEQTKILEGRLPLSPGSHLSWLGFSDTGFLSSFDSKGLLRAYCPEFGGSWVPVLCASKELKNENESLWMVGLNNTQAFCIVCKHPDKQPQVSPKPVLSVFNFSTPLACSDLGADDLENEYLLGSRQLVQMADEIACKAEEDDQDEEILKLEANLDKCTLRLIAAACKGDKLVKAVELTKRLTLEKSWKGAIKLVSAMRLPALAERLSSMYEEKLLQESSQCQSTQDAEKPEMGAVHLSQSSIPAATNTPVSKFDDVRCQQQHERSLRRSMAPAPISNAEVVRDVKVDRSNTMTATTGSAEVAADEQCRIDPEERIPTAVPANDTSLQRPNNPFAKSPALANSTADRKSEVSLLQSLKRMRGPDLEIKGKEMKGASQLKPAKSVKTAS